jgi:hypothetical protein
VLHLVHTNRLTSHRGRSQRLKVPGGKRAESMESS